MKGRGGVHPRGATRSFVGFASFGALAGDRDFGGELSVQAQVFHAGKEAVSGLHAHVPP